MTPAITTAAAISDEARHTDRLDLRPTTSAAMLLLHSVTRICGGSVQEATPSRVEP
jgi:hypothetical protein